MVLGRRAFIEGLGATVAGGAGAPFQWPKGARGAVSLTYDDGLTSHLDVAAPALEARGWRGNFFLTLENMADRVSDWKKVAASGHELCNHTIHHRCDLRPFNPDRYIHREIVEAQTVFDAQFGKQPRIFAYPCGATNLGAGNANQELHRYTTLLSHAGFEAARTSDGDPMNPSYAWRKRMALNATAPTYEKDSPAEAIDYLELALRRGAWAILVFHTLTPGKLEPGDTSVATHDAILDAIAQRPFWVAPMGEVLEQVRPKALRI